MNKRTLVKGTRCIVADNSGAKTVMIIGLYKNKRSIEIGDRVKVAIKTAVPNGKIKSGEMSEAIVVRTKDKKNYGACRIGFRGPVAVILIDKPDAKTGKISIRATKLLGRSSSMVVGKDPHRQQKAIASAFEGGVL